MMKAMKLLLTASVALLLLSQTDGAAAARKKRPNYLCDRDSDCEKHFPDTVCIIVDNYGDKIGKCTPNSKKRPACRGSQPGLCPSYQDAERGYLNAHCVFTAVDDEAELDLEEEDEDEDEVDIDETDTSSSGAEETRFLMTAAASEDGSDEEEEEDEDDDKKVEKISKKYARVVIGNKTFTGEFICVDVSDCENKAADKTTCEPKTCGASSASKMQCNNQGTCTYPSIQTMERRRCMCYSGFEGNLCQKEVSGECDVDCGIGGDCVKGQCVCKAGYDGKTVGGKSGKPDQRCRRCTNDKACENDSPCNTDSGKCQCDPGYFGPTCGATEDGCTKLTCKNDGNCQLLQNGTGACFCNICVGSECAQCETPDCMACPSGARTLQPSMATAAALFASALVVNMMM